MSKGAQKAPSQRQLRVGEEIRHILANVLERGDVRDPDVAGKVITVTEVSISPDLRNASVYVVEMGGGDIKSLLTGLKRVASFFRHELSKKMNLRIVPMLHFHPDTSFDRASRIESLLALPEVRRDLGRDLESDSSESDE
ncbi:MAG TPA: 30S ribosome-binding factor RbfA [Magnetospirillaceae bacterium]|nr:30S ribosome-binding factor RbfA [Magnetospirillaceae bacterium]